MSGATIEQVNLLLKLYDARRETKVREARGLVRSELSSANRRRSDETVSPGQPGEFVHAHGRGLLGDGGQHREPRADRRRTLLRKQRRNVGSVRAAETDARRLA